MKKINITLTLIFGIISATTFSQTKTKEYKLGHIFYVNIPDYMDKTSGLNDYAVIQYGSKVKDTYGFIIEDQKEDLETAEMVFSSINEFYENFIKEFAKTEKKRKVSEPKYSKQGEINFVECDLSYYSKEAKTEIFYLVGIVETKNSFYKVLSWTTAENKDKIKADLQKIIYSVKD